MKKVMILVWKDGIGGAERSLYEILSKFLMYNIKYEITVVYLSGVPIFFAKKIEQMGYSVKYLNWKNGYSIIGRLKLIMLINKIKPQIIHEHITPPLTGIFIKLLFRSKIIRSEHGEAIRHSVGGNIFLRFIHTFEYVFYDLFIANSYTTKEALIKAYYIPKEKIKVIYLGIDFDYYKKCKNVNKGNITCNIGYLGRIFDKHKGVFYLPYVAKKLKNKGYYKVNFIVGGDGPDFQKLKFLCHKLQVEHLFNFVGWVYDACDFFNKIDILVIPSRFESFSMTALEALAAGVKVVGFSIPAIEECFSEYTFVKLVPFGDVENLAESIISFISTSSNDYEKESLFQKLCEKFSIFNTVKMTHKIYESII
ncbi:MAG: glycosyltransferase family 4 protein [Endomicrobia bacterium]|nr:glycosyltransferase family 4 protein [Endomicrobiia bacterium]